RFSRDWSSDVCSSDLVLVVPLRGTEYHEVKIMAFIRFIAYGEEIALAFARCSPGIFAIATPIVEHKRKAPFSAEPGVVCHGPFRSEERRVGKGWEPRW